MVRTPSQHGQEPSPAQSVLHGCVSGVIAPAAAAVAAGEDLATARL